jgi:bifunctional non-homologous end joining protein LigD
MSAVRDVAISNPDRVLFPAAGFRKRDLVAWYDAVGEVLLPHIRRRPITLVRFPEGVEGKGWYQAQCRGRPSWLPTFEVEGAAGEVLRYCLVEEPAALRWLANIGTLELHPFLWAADAPYEPTHLVFDLDPGPPATIVDCCRIALRLRPMLEAIGGEPVAKTTGSLGLHVVVGVAPGATFSATKAFARTVAEALAADAPEFAVARSNRAERRGRVFVDWVMNDGGRSLIAPYSLRAMTWPLVATPVSWDDVEGAADGADWRGLYFLPEEVRGRIDRLGDLHQAALRRLAHLPTPTSET